MKKISEKKTRLRFVISKELSHSSIFLISAYRISYLRGSRVNRRREGKCADRKFCRDLILRSHNTTAFTYVSLKAKNTLRLPLGRYDAYKVNYPLGESK